MKQRNIKAAGWLVSVMLSAGAFWWMALAEPVIAEGENYPVLIENIPMRIEIQTQTGSKRCSGSAIDPKTAVTAAHCLKGAVSVRIIQNGEETNAVSWETEPGYRAGKVEGDLAYITTNGGLETENHTTVKPGQYDLRGWVLDNRGTTVRGCVIDGKLEKHDGHYHVRCPLGRGSSGAGLWFYDNNSKWELVGVVSQYDRGIVSITDVKKQD